MDAKEIEIRKAVVWEATKLVGTPYLWGGNYTVEGGLDCMGFVLCVWGMCGVDLPDMTANTAFEYLEKTANPLPGDVAFYGPEDGRVTHVMMVLSFDPKDLVVGASGGVSFRRIGIPADHISELTDEESAKYAQEMAERGAKVKYAGGYLYRSDFRGFGRLPYEKRTI